MLYWSLVACGVVIALLIASLLAAYVYGRFAKRSRGIPSYALEREGAPTRLDEWAGKLTKERTGYSGFRLLSSNLDALAARALSARAAERSLDLMYYIWQNDLTGRLLFRELIAAADRGVRVRILLDDVGVHGFDAKFLAIGSHPNVELRLFNPTQARGNRLRRGIEMALRMFSVTRRMHNKAWVADGRVAIVGGRNIGDEYFDADEGAHFRDLDLLAIGPVVDETERMFDRYWNSGLALPIGVLADVEPLSLKALKAQLEALASGERAAPYLGRVRERLSITSLLNTDSIAWCEEARLVCDPPEKALGKKGDNWMMRELLPLLAASRHRLEIMSPYFVPGVEGTSRLLELVSRQVHVAVLTNSLAATDVALVHGGYAPYRRPLLRGGVKLFELRPYGKRSAMSLRGSRHASLHTKAFTVDEHLGFIGSLNFDPRSASVNTEMGILFSNRTLVSQIQALFTAETAPVHSYRVALSQQGALSWHCEDDGEAVIYRHEPKASLSRRLVARIVTVLPIESQL